MFGKEVGEKPLADSGASRVRLLVSGRVQGVGFRWAAEAEARRLALVGWVRNLHDGDVEVLAEGERPVLEEFSSWCRRGPPLAEVTGVEMVWEEATGEFATFGIRRTASRGR